MRKCMIRFGLGLLVMVGLLLGMVATAFAEGEYKEENPETGYQVIIQDDADLLSENEEQDLAKCMEPITAYGGACFLTLNENNGTARSAAESTYYRYFGNRSGILFLIDMDNRQIWMSVNGAIYEIVTDKYCTTITDNVYKYATKGDYAGCAEKAFVQVDALLSGHKIAQPMKYISNGLLAVVLAILLNFCLVILVSNRWKKSTYGTSTGSAGDVTVRNLAISRNGTKKTYSPLSSDSGGSGGGGSSSGGGGGGFSGGGGGHSF